MSNEGAAFVGLLALPVLAAAGALWLTYQATKLAVKGIIWAGKGAVYCGRRLNERVNAWTEEREQTRIASLVQISAQGEASPGPQQTAAEQQQWLQLQAATREVEHQRRETELLQQRIRIEEDRRERESRQQVWEQQQARIAVERQRREQEARGRAEQEWLRQQAELQEQMRQAEEQERQRVEQELQVLEATRRTTQLKIQQELERWQAEQTRQAETALATFLQQQLEAAATRFATLDPVFVPAQAGHVFLSKRAESANALGAGDYRLAVVSANESLEAFSELMPAYVSARTEHLRQNLAQQGALDEAELLLNDLQTRLTHLPTIMAGDIRDERDQLAGQLLRLRQEYLPDAVPALVERAQLARKRLDRVVEKWYAQRREAEVHLNESLAINDLLEYDEVLGQIAREVQSEQLQQLLELQEQVRALIASREYAQADATARDACLAAESLKNAVLSFLTDQQIQALVKLAHETLQQMGYQVDAVRYQGAHRLSAWRGENNFEILISAEGIAFNLDGFTGAACLQETNAFFEELKRHGVQFDPEAITPTYRGGPRGSAQALSEWVERILVGRLGARIVEERTGVPGTEIVAQWQEPEKEAEVE